MYGRLRTLLKEGIQLAIFGFGARQQNSQVRLMWHLPGISHSSPYSLSPPHLSALKLLSSLPARLPLLLGAQRKQLLLDTRGATNAFFRFYALFSPWFPEVYLAALLWNRRCQVECTEAKARDNDSVEISLVVRGTQGISGIDFGSLKTELRSKAHTLGKAGQELW